ncbi:MULTISPECIES: sugar phosphate isomerase/epimerase [unclassified Paenibacillus]|uniref:sugar phosphate isomerase/epimerase family protein n=1 Tax=unclassified Paenibacillus TaxID=185978 RepID=UPI002788A986|nr:MULTISPECIES: sugar phosphate isomerase/epimerase family protein [unclassified Paenibacillus]MDQ0898038.1 sugar phosphate isomerase/epimerase [Paenibacillus sp. V4I7]MDQ0915957.1 sugar phosphate isomerase/epimerase [Paenibacillus sp. V4I5]
MKVGVSTYSLFQALKSGEMDIMGVIDWIADQGGEHVEIVPLGYDLTGNLELADEIRLKAQSRGIEISNYAIGANFLTDSQEAYEQEIKRVKGEVDLAARLGVQRMRHDVAQSEDRSIANFNKELERMAEACRQIADYASQYGIITSVENHGYFVQHSDRVQTLIQAVDRPNFRTTLDVGNFMCVDEDPVAAVKNNLLFASMVHVKDFYLRPSYQNPGKGWFQTLQGNHLRGAIVGHGDIDMKEVLRVIKSSGYDGFISLEFEGMEECKMGTMIGLQNIRRLWDDVE